MTLRYTDTEWGPPLEKLEGESTKIPIPKDISPVISKPPKILSEVETQACYGWFTPVRYVPDHDSGRWVPKIDVTSTSTQYTDLLTDNSRFTESQKGVFSVRNGKPQQQVTNACVRIYKIRRVWHTENDFDDNLICRVSCKEAWGEETQEIEIKKSEYKNLFKKIHQKWPSVFLSTQDGDSIEAYLTKVFQSASNVPVENVSDKIGWLSINGHPVYYMGIASYYKGYELPDVFYSDRRTVFLQGFSFLQVGDFNNEVSILWIVAHIAYSLYWFDKAGVKFRSLLFLKGETNLFKSAIAEVITNVFKVDRTQSSKRLNSTRASLQEYLSKSQDNFVLIDDFSNSVGANNKKMIENAEFVIRAIGDGQFPGKMSLSDRSKIKDTQVRCTVVATGEEAFGLSTSSEYRMITLNVVKDTFDSQILSWYQDNPTMLRDYYALYIQFLQNCGTTIVELCKSRLPQYRNHFRNLSVPRFIDAAVALSLQVDTLQEFARYCGTCEEDVVQEALQSCPRVILDVLQRNQASTVTGKPEVRFLKALMQSIGTDKYNGLADNEEVYAKDESNFIGFRDTDNNQIWLRFSDSFNLVKKYYWQLGEQFLTKETTLKDTLVRQGIAVGKINENGVNQYLMRAKKGSRKYLLVLNMPKVYEILEGDGF